MHTFLGGVEPLAARFLLAARILVSQSQTESIYTANSQQECNTRTIQTHFCRPTVSLSTLINFRWVRSVQCLGVGEGGVSTALVTGRILLMGGCPDLRIFLLRRSPLKTPPHPLWVCGLKRRWLLLTWIFDKVEEGTEEGGGITWSIIDQSFREIRILPFRTSKVQCGVRAGGKRSREMKILRGVWKKRMMWRGCVACVSSWQT